MIRIIENATKEQLYKKLAFDEDQNPNEDCYHLILTTRSNNASIRYTRGISTKTLAKLNRYLKLNPNTYYINYHGLYNKDGDVYDTATNTKVFCKNNGVL